MTEMLIAATFALASLVLVGTQDPAPLIKALVWGSAMGSLLLHIAGRAVTAPERLRAAVGETLRDWWPVTLLALYILGGSLYARFVDNIRETFLGFGLGMLFLPLVAVAVRVSARPLGLLKWLAAIYVCSSLAMLVLLGLGRGLFHEEIFVAVPLGAYLLCRQPLRAAPTLLGLTLVGIYLLSFKNTTFLLVLTTLLACSAVWIARVTAGRDRLRVVAGVYFAMLVLLGAAAALAIAYLTFRSNLPDGSTEYRFEMYGIAWQRFLDSPVWGSAFTDSSVTYFELYRIAVGIQTLPTHSDVLDLMAHGGLIAIGLWVLTVWRLLAIGWHVLRVVAAGVAPGSGGDDGEAADMRPWRWLFVVMLIELGAIITYAFNPLLHRPAHGVLIWGTAGLAWALHRHLTRPQHRPQPRPAAWHRRRPVAA